MCFKSLNLWLGVQKGPIVCFYDHLIFRISCVKMNRLASPDFQNCLAPTSGTPCHFPSLVCLECCYISRWCFSYHANSSRFVLSRINYGEKKKSFGSTHFRAIFHVGSGSQHIHRAWQKTSHTLRGTFRDAELLFQPQFSSFDAIHSCLSFCEAEIGHWTVNLGKKNYFYASYCCD